MPGFRPGTSRTFSVRSTPEALFQPFVSFEWTDATGGGGGLKVSAEMTLSGDKIDI